MVTNGVRVLAYELHVTNFGARPLVLGRVEVQGRNSARIFMLQDSALRAAVHVLDDAGMAMNMNMNMTAGQARITAGGRAIVFMWIGLPLDSAVPRTLRHRLIFATAESGTISPDVELRT